MLLEKQFLEKVAIALERANTLATLQRKSKVFQMLDHFEQNIFIEWLLSIREAEVEAKTRLHVMEVNQAEMAKVTKVYNLKTDKP